MVFQICVETVVVLAANLVRFDAVQMRGANRFVPVVFPAFACSLLVFAVAAVAVQTVEARSCAAAA